MRTPSDVVGMVRVRRKDGSETERWLTTCVKTGEGPYYTCRIHLDDGEEFLDSCYVERGADHPGAFAELTFGAPSDIRIDFRRRCPIGD